MPYLIDLHCHTQELSFDGKIPAAEIIDRLKIAGFSGVVFTDHNHVWPRRELDRLRRETEVGDEFLLESGQEVRSAVDGVTAGDLLVYGPQVDLPDGTEIARIFELIDECDGFCIAAHPAVPRIGLGKQTGDFPILAAEVWNGRYGKRAADAAAELLQDLSMTLVGGSDTHSEKDVAGGGTEFEELPASLSHVKRLIEDERCIPWKPRITERVMKWIKQQGEP